MSEKKKPSFLVKFTKAMLPVALLAAGGASWAYFKTTAPVIPKAAPQRQSAVVRVLPATTGEAETFISAMGTVASSREVALKARVSGAVVSVSDRFVPGGRLAQGEVMMTLDPSDYEVAVKKAQSALLDAQAALAVEQGNQTIAREELRLLAETSGEAVLQTDLALRKPQLQQAEAAVESARADLRQARLDLNRTAIRIPFNAMILERSVNLGAYVSAGESLATIADTDEYWVEAMVPLDQVSLIDMDRPGGAPAAIRSQSGSGTWQGKVARVAGKLSDTSRMATVIVAISNPLEPASGPSSPRLMVDDYVSVEIAGRALSQVVSLPRSALQDDNTVWVCSQNKLDIRPVTLAWKSDQQVFVQNGLLPGDQVVVSELSSPVQGMSLQVVNDEADNNTSHASVKES